jgi:hypothetical protein
MTAQKKALEQFGIRAQIMKTAEEAAELAAAALQYLERESPEALDHFFEELADNEIMGESMRLHFGDLKIDAWRTKKLTRLENRLGITMKEFSAPRPERARPRDGQEDKAERKAPEPRALKEPGRVGKKGGTNKRQCRPIYVDGVRYDSTNQAKAKFGPGIYLALKQGRDFRGHTVSWEAPAERAEA